MREITINGKTVKLETGQEMPPRTWGREKSDFRLLLEAMTPGESADLPIADSISSKSVTMRATGQGNGLQYNYRTLGNGMVRIFCNSAAKSKVEPIKKAAGWA